MREKDPIEVELLVHALRVKISSYQKNYDTFVEDMNDLCAICIEFSEQKIELTEPLKLKIKETAEILLQHYPNGEKMLYENFEYICASVPSVGEFKQTYVRKFEKMPLRVAR
jgi:hypothetical protein